MLIFLVIKNFYVLEFKNCVVNFDKNENKNLIKKIHNVQIESNLARRPGQITYVMCRHFAQ